MLHAVLLAVAVAMSGNPGQIDAYVTPYYNSSGPVLDVGKYSNGLASREPGTFVRTILSMKRQWSTLNFAELYVGAIRLFDRGYRNEATYWFYTAQYRGRLFASLVDQKKLGGIGAPAFELYHAQDAFFQLVGPSINGFAYGDLGLLEKILDRVARESASVPNLNAVYPGVAFTGRSTWAKQNAAVDTGLKSLAGSLSAEKKQIAAQRAQNGTQARYSSLTSKRFPGGY